MRVKTALLLFSVLALVPGVQALHIQDNTYFTIPQDDVKCIEVVLPDDIGVIVPGLFEYEISLVPEPSLSWADLTSQIVRTDENATVKVPICFSSFGKQQGECSKSFTLTIESSDLGIFRTFSGSCCVSGISDVDNGPGDDNGDSDNVDVFDMGFKEDVKYSEPGETVTYTLRLQSYASVVIDLSVESELPATLSKNSVTLSQTNPMEEVSLMVQAPEQEGQYEVNVTGAIATCDNDFCGKKEKGILIVDANPPDQTGFTVSVFPKTINVEDLMPVTFQITITNNGPQEAFEVTAEIPPGLTTDFQPGNYTVPSGDERTIALIVTPVNVSSGYEIEACATNPDISPPLTKCDSAYLSTNELLTDPTDNAAGIDDPAADDALDDWYNTYRDLDYGDGLDDYSDLQNEINSMRVQAQTQTCQDECEKKCTGMPAGETPILTQCELADFECTCTGTGDGGAGDGGEPGPGLGAGETGGGLDVWTFVYIAVAAAVVAVLFLVYRKKGAGEEEMEVEFER